MQTLRDTGLIFRRSLILTLRQPVWILPLALAPDWLKFLSTLNPLTHAADAARALFNGDWSNPEIAIGAAIMGALAVLAVWLASRAFNRAVA